MGSTQLAGLADCNDDGLLLTFAQLIGEGLVVHEGVKKYRHRLQGLAL